MDENTPQFEPDRATAWWRWFVRRSVLLPLAAIVVVTVGVWVFASLSKNMNNETGSNQKSLETSLVAAKASANNNGIVTVATRLIEGEEKGTYTYEDSKLAALHLDRGMAYMNLSKYEDAVKDLDKAKSLDKNSTVAALQAEVEARYKMGQRKEVIPVYEELIEAVKRSDYPTRSSYITQYQENIQALQAGRELPF